MKSILKKIFIMVVLAPLSFLSFGQAIQVTCDDDFVGIGGISPTSTLHLINHGWLRFNATQTKAGLLFYETGTSTSTDVYYGARIYYDQVADGLVLATKNVGLEKLGIFITRGYGKVGVGRNDPSYKLDVTGSIRASGTVTWSDSRLKKNIVEINNSNEIIEKLKMLDAISYTPVLPDAEKFFNSINNNEDTLSAEIIERQKKRYERIQYGYDAEDMKEHFSELVSEDDEGYLGIDYVSMIPLIIEAFKGQQERIIDLEEEIEQLLSNNNYKSGLITPNSIETTLDNPSILYQNTPNPFNEDTEIKLNISENVITSTLIVYDMQGTQLRSYNIQERGLSSVIIYGYELDPGMYLYSLITDGEEVGTKRMILTD